MDNDTLVRMLKRKPKEVEQMRTRNAFRKFFNGMPRERVEMLLRRAYGDLGEEQCEVKVKKRIGLLID